MIGMADVAGGLAGAPGFDHRIHSYDPKTVSGLGSYLSKNIDNVLAGQNGPVPNFRDTTDFAKYISLRDGKSDSKLGASQVSSETAPLIGSLF
jgi:hypothetical protein